MRTSSFHITASSLIPVCPLSATPRISARPLNTHQPHSHTPTTTGHLLAVGNEGIQTIAVGADAPPATDVDKVEAESEHHMFPVLYMLESHVKCFTGMRV